MLLLFLACADPCPLWYSDLDADGFGAGEGVRSCEALSARTVRSGDCDDRDPSTFPGAVDPPNDSLDQDCSGDDLCDGAELISGGSWDCDGGAVTVEGSLNDPSSDPRCLCSVWGDLRVSDASAADYTALQSVGGTLWLSGTETDLELPSLLAVGTLRVDGGIETLDLPLLRSAQTLRIRGMDTLRLPQLQEADSLVISLSGPELSLPRLLTVETVYADHEDAGYQRVLLPALGAGGFLRVHAAEYLDLQAPAGSLSAVEVYGPSAHVRLPAAMERLSVDSDIRSVSGTETLETLSLDTGTALLALDLRHVQKLTLVGARLEAPVLEEIPDLAVYSGTLAALSLHTVDELRVSEATLETPRLDFVWRLDGADSVLPDLRGVNRADYDGSLPALSSVEASLRGAVIAPSLQVLDGAAVIHSSTESLPALQYAAQDLVLSGAAWLPALRRVDGPLILVDSPSFYAPELLTVDWLTLRGDTTAELPDPLPWGLRLEEWQPSAPAPFGALQAGLAIADGDNQSVAVEATSVAGNVEIQAPYWSEIPVSLGPVGGELRYCLASLSEQTLSVWLAEQDVAGEQVNLCP